MTNEQCGTSGHHEHLSMCFRKHVSWTAIIVGALVGVGLSFLLNLFSIAIGLSFVTTKEGVAVLAVGGFIGLAIGIIVSMFVAGFSAGYLGRPFCMKRNLGVLYGFTTWSLILILTVLLTASMGRYITSYSDFVTNPTIVVETTDKQVTSTGKASSSAAINTETQIIANRLGMSALFVFALFFISAFSCCLGGHCGMTCRCEEDNISTK